MKLELSIWCPDFT